VNGPGGGWLRPWPGPSIRIKVRSSASRRRSRLQLVMSTNRLCQSTAGGPEPSTSTFNAPSRVGTVGMAAS
jgi:hypothetical protein